MEILNLMTNKVIVLRHINLFFLKDDMQFGNYVNGFAS